MCLLRSISLNNVLIILFYILFYQRAHKLKITNEYIYCSVVVSINVPIEIRITNYIIYKFVS